MASPATEASATSAAAARLSKRPGLVSVRLVEGHDIAPAKGAHRGHRHAIDARS